MFRYSGLVCGLALAATNVAHAQQVIQETQTTTAAPAANAMETRRVSQILGSTVRLQGNNNFGTVDDIVLDNNGGIGYLVVSNGGRYAMLPWNAGNMNYGQRFVSYNVAPQALQPLYFEKNAWPNVYAEQYTTRMRRIFPGLGATRREVLRPVPAGTVPPPEPGIVKEKVRVAPNGDVKVKERIR